MLSPLCNKNMCNNTYIYLRNVLLPPSRTTWSGCWSPVDRSFDTAHSQPRITPLRNASAWACRDWRAIARRSDRAGDHTRARVLKQHLTRCMRQLLNHSAEDATVKCEGTKKSPAPCNTAKAGFSSELSVCPVTTMKVIPLSAALPVMGVAIFGSTHHPRKPSLSWSPPQPPSPASSTVSSVVFCPAAAAFF